MGKTPHTPETLPLYNLHICFNFDPPLPQNLTRVLTKDLPGENIGFVLMCYTIS